MNESMKGYQYIARILKGYGVTHVFYMEAMLRMTLRELEMLGVKGIMAHTESAAGYMADGYARVSGRPGVCMVQSIGAANLVGGVHEAWLANTPVIALTGKKEAKYQYRNSYQEADHRLFYESITKFNADLTESEQLPYLLRQCFRESVTGKPGPVHIDLIDHIGRTIELSTINEPLYIDETFKKYPAFRYSAEIDLVEEAAKIINEAKRPVIVAGRGARISDADDEIYLLAVKSDIPVATTLDGKALIDENDPLWVGIVGDYGMDCANKTVINADLVIFIGTQTGDQATHDWNVPLQNVKVIQIDIEASELGKNYPNSLLLLGDAKNVTAQLVEEVKESSRVKWREEVAEYVKSTMSEYKRFLASDSTPIRPERLCAEISKALSDDTILIADTGYSAIWSAIMIKMRPTQIYLRSAGSLGWAFPASLGVKCGAPERQVICFVGDGAIYYHLSEMETAVRYGINTITIINNNQEFGQCADDIKRIYENDPESGAARYTFTNVNLSKIAEEFGCFAIRVEKPEDIRLAIKKATKAEKPAVIEVTTDRNAKVPAPLKTIKV